MSNTYARFREDGWPLCPICEQDELYSRIMLAWNGEGERPTVDECIAGEMACYNCRWDSWKAKLLNVLQPTPAA